jgi:hypothetical protein
VNALEIAVFIQDTWFCRKFIRIKKDQYFERSYAASSRIEKQSQSIKKKIKQMIKIDSV